MMNYIIVIGVALMVCTIICILAFVIQILQQYNELTDNLAKIKNSLKQCDELKGKLEGAKNSSELFAHLLSTEQSNNQFVVDQICRIERRLKEIADNKMDK